MRLFELTAQFKALEALEFSDELPAEVIADTLEALEGDFEVKAVAVAKFVLTLEAEADAIAGAAAAMKLRAERVQRRSESIRAYLQFQMQALAKMRIDTPELVIKRVVNPPAVQVTDEDAIPDQFWVQPEPPPERIDKKALKAALQAGEQVAGAYLEAGERLAITV
jgi:hypothetical protein